MSTGNEEWKSLSIPKYTLVMYEFRCIMNTVRTNITLPFHIADMLKNVKNKSSFIAEAIREKFEKEEKAWLIKELTEGYKTRKSEDKRLSNEWDTATGDGID
jgi:hypothetical protein